MPETPSMQVALKEWAVLLEAMAAGRQIFLLRKGGIAEGRSGFELKHREFLFFPTWEHQQAAALKPSFRELFDQLQPPDPGTIEIRYAGRVEQIREAPRSLNEMAALDGQHIFTGAYLQKRYEYRPDLPLYIVVVRLMRLAASVRILNERRYAGCRSWVDLAEPVETGELQPVIEQVEFDALRERLTTVLGA
jgi:hypothetical protein